MRNGCWIPKTTNTHSEHVTLIVFQPQWLHERACMLRYSTLPELFNVLPICKQERGPYVISSIQHYLDTSR